MNLITDEGQKQIDAQRKYDRVTLVFPQDSNRQEFERVGKVIIVPFPGVGGVMMPTESTTVEMANGHVTVTCPRFFAEANGIAQFDRDFAGYDGDIRGDDYYE